MEPKNVAKYQIIVSKRALKFLDKLNKKLRLKIINDLKCLEDFPFFTRHLDIVKLKGRKNYYRLREVM
jgi:mRNA-degrading endonuclease RelE of RelBE toxin-antitoxin system